MTPVQAAALRNEAESVYPALYQFLACYFHEDWLENVTHAPRNAWLVGQSPNATCSNERCVLTQQMQVSKASKHWPTSTAFSVVQSSAQSLESYCREAFLFATGLEALRHIALGSTRFEQRWRRSLRVRPNTSIERTASGALRAPAAAAHFER
jgi:hypothetical protein